MTDKRVHVITGHFGSGKTEFSVNYTLDLKNELDKVSILDMDIANPYFRSRERQKMMEEKGISIHFNTYGYDISEDLPAITATVRAPLENKDYETVVDMGGNDSGARIMNQFRKYFITPGCEIMSVINANRPDTENLKLCLQMIKSIEEEIDIKVDVLINNTHLLRETTVYDIIKGYELCEEIRKEIGVPVKFNTCVSELVNELVEAALIKGYDPIVLEGAGHSPDNFEGLGQPGKMYIYPITLQMRPSWLDVQV